MHDLIKISAHVACGPNLISRFNVSNFIYAENVIINSMCCCCLEMHKASTRTNFIITFPKDMSYGLVQLLKTEILWNAHVHISKCFKINTSNWTERNVKLLYCLSNKFLESQRTTTTIYYFSMKKWKFFVNPVLYLQLFKVHSIY